VPSRRTLTTVVVLILLSVSIITLDQRSSTHHVFSGLRSVTNTVFSPFASGLNGILRPVGNFFAGAVDYGSLRDENQKLQATIGNLRQQQAEQAFENSELRQLLALQKLPYLNGLPTVLAATTQLNTSNFAATIEIDKGRDDGVTVGMPVVGGGGLVGQVVEAFHHSATVRLVTDGQSTVGAEFGPGSTQAIVTGQGPTAPLEGSLVPIGTNVTKGQTLYTSGLQGGAFPAGIPIGTIASSYLTTGENSITLKLTPSADLSQLAYVAVVEWEPTP
jgi:rod shape-determining protein MreC